MYYLVFILSPVHRYHTQKASRKDPIHHLSLYIFLCIIRNVYSIHLSADKTTTRVNVRKHNNVRIRNDVVRPEGIPDNYCIDKLWLLFENYYLIIHQF